MTRTVILILICLASAFAQGKQQVHIAVTDLDRRGGIDSNEIQIISDRLREDLLKTGEFRVMERSMMDKLLREQSFTQASGCNGSECQIQMGKLLGVDAMVVGSAGKIGKMYTISVRLLDIETGEIVLTSSQDHRGEIEDLLGEPMTQVADQVANTIRKKKTPDAAPAVVKPQGPGLSGAAKWRIGLGVGSLALLGTAVFFNSQVSSKNNEITDLEKKYRDATTTTIATAYHNQIVSDRDAAKSAETKRNITGAVGLLLLAGIGITFAF